MLVALAGVAALVDWWSVARERLGVEFIAKPLVVIGLIGAALAVDTGDGVVPVSYTHLTLPTKQAV